MTVTTSDFGVSKFKALIPAATFAAVIESLMGVLSSVVAGNLLGSDALSAVNLSMPVMNAVTFVAALVGIGTSVNCSYHSGRCEIRRAHEYFSQGFWTAVALGGLVFGVILFGHGAFLAYLDPGVEIASQARTYLLWFLPCAVLEPVAILLVNAVMLDGDSRRCFLSYCVQLTVNGLFSCLLVGRMGVAGCALATVLANLAAVVILSGHFAGKSCSFRLVRHFSAADSLRIMGASVGDAATFVCSAALFFILNKFTLSVYGSEQIPVLAGVICAISMLEFFNGVGNALGPVLGVYYGEGNVGTVIRLLCRATAIALEEGFLVTGLLIVCPSVIVRLIGVTDAATVLEAERAVQLVSLGFAGYALIYLFNSYFVFVGHDALAFVATVLNGLLLPAALVFTLGHFSLTALWVAVGLSPVVAVLIISAYLTFSYGFRKFPHLLDISLRDKIISFSLTLEPAAISSASEDVRRLMGARGVSPSGAMKASLMTEEVFMSVRESNAHAVRGEVVLDFRDRARLILRDDGRIFDITDVNREVSSLRAYLVASVMEVHAARGHYVTTGFNRNIFVFE